MFIYTVQDVIAFFLLTMFVVFFGSIYIFEKIKKRTQKGGNE